MRVPFEDFSLFQFYTSTKSLRDKTSFQNQISESRENSFFRKWLFHQVLSEFRPLNRISDSDRICIRTGFRRLQNILQNIHTNSEKWHFVANLLSKSLKVICDQKCSDNCNETGTHWQSLRGCELCNFVTNCNSAWVNHTYSIHRGRNVEFHLTERKDLSFNYQHLFIYMQERKRRQIALLQQGIEGQNDTDVDFDDGINAMDNEVFNEVLENVQHYEETLQLPPPLTHSENQIIVEEYPPIETVYNDAVNSHERSQDLQTIYQRNSNFEFTQEQVQHDEASIEIRENEDEAEAKNFTDEEVIIQFGQETFDAHVLIELNVFKAKCDSLQNAKEIFEFDNDEKHFVLEARQNFIKRKHGIGSYVLAPSQTAATHVMETKRFECIICGDEEDFENETLVVALCEGVQSEHKHYTVYHIKCMQSSFHVNLEEAKKVLKKNLMKRINISLPKREPKSPFKCIGWRCAALIKETMHVLTKAEREAKTIFPLDCPSCDKIAQPLCHYLTGCEWFKQVKEKTSEDICFQIEKIFKHIPFSIQSKKDMKFFEQINQTKHFYSKVNSVLFPEEERICLNASENQRSYKTSTMEYFLKHLSSILRELCYFLRNPTDDSWENFKDKATHALKKLKRTSFYINHEENCCKIGLCFSSLNEQTFVQFNELFEIVKPFFQNTKIGFEDCLKSRTLNEHRKFQTCEVCKKTFSSYLDLCKHLAKSNHENKHFLILQSFAYKVLAVSSANSELVQFKRRSLNTRNVTTEKVEKLYKKVQMLNDNFKKRKAQIDGYSGYENYNGYDNYNRYKRYRY